MWSLLISEPMFNFVFSPLALLRSSFKTRLELQLEILALRHQLAILQSSMRKRPRFRDTDRLLWVWLSQLWSGWRQSLVIVRLETVMAWHRKGFRLYWRWKSRPRRPGRPVLRKEVRDLIRQTEHPATKRLISQTKGAVCPFGPSLAPSVGFLPLERSQVRRQKRSRINSASVPSGAAGGYGVSGRHSRQIHPRWKQDRVR